MTRRERLERRAENRREWAEKRRQNASELGARADRLAEVMNGQPILVGHHSEKRHRRDLDRMWNTMHQSVESSKMADHHESKAANLERSLAKTVFSDDPDAIDALEAKAYGLEVERNRMKSVNKAWRKAGEPGPADDEGWTRVRELSAAPNDFIHTARMRMARCHWETRPFPTYALTNIGARIRDARKRIEDIKKQAELQAKTEAAGGILITRTEMGYCNVRFAEKPSREVIGALKAAGFSWGGGNWGGYTDRIPECVLALEADNTHE